MPKCSILPPALERRRYHVAAVGDGGGAEHDDDVAVAFGAFDGRRKGPRCSTSCMVAIVAPAGAELLEHARRLVDGRFEAPAGQGRDHATFSGRNARTASRAFLAAETRGRAPLRHGERNDLHGGDHLALDDARIAGNVASVIASSSALTASIAAGSRTRTPFFVAKCCSVR